MDRKKLILKKIQAQFSNCQRAATYLIAVLYGQKYEHAEAKKLIISAIHDLVKWKQLSGYYLHVFASVEWEKKIFQKAG